MKHYSDIELKIFLTIYSQRLEENVVDFLNDEVVDPNLLYKPAIKTFLLYTCSVVLREYYNNIDELIIELLNQIGSEVDNITRSVFPESRSARSEMLSAFNDYRELEKTQGLNSVRRIEENFSKNVYRYGSIDTSGILQHFTNLLRENV